MASIRAIGEIAVQSAFGFAVSNDVAVVRSVGDGSASRIGRTGEQGAGRGVLRMFENIGRATLLDNDAVRHYDHAIDIVVREVHVVGRDQQSPFAARQPTQRLA